MLYLKKDQLDQCFISLLEKIHDALFRHSSGFLLVTLRDMFRNMLRDRGYPEWDQYKSNRLKLRLQEHYGESVIFFQQSGGSEFVCSADVSIGDVLGKLQKLVEDEGKLKEEQRVMDVAKILRGKS